MTYKHILEKCNKILNETEQGLLEELICNDVLTGIKNRRTFNNEIEIEIHKAERIGYDVTLMMIDIDDFKKYNDTKGHQEGDKILIDTAEIIRESIRDIDEVYRYGGDEFACIFPNTDILQGKDIAERVRKEIESIDITISVGLSNYKGTSNNLHDFISHSDYAMYESKRTGKNKITIYGEVKQ